jgi:hypothetical protein
MKDPEFKYCSMKTEILGSGCNSQAKREISGSEGASLFEKTQSFCREICVASYALIEEAHEKCY